MAHEPGVPMSTGEDWFGTPAAAKYLGVTLRTVYRIIDRGELAAFRVGRVLRVRRIDLEAFLQEHQVEPGSLGHLYKTGDDEDCAD